MVEAICPRCSCIASREEWEEYFYCDNCVSAWDYCEVIDIEDDND